MTSPDPVTAESRPARRVRRHTVQVEVLGPWSLTTSRTFWEGFSPAALQEQRAGDRIRTVFLVEADWSPAEVEVTQHADLATLTLAGGGDLEAAAVQVGRFLSLDVDARGWPAVARRDPVIADAQHRLPGLRPCGFHSPYEAAAWSVLSQRVRIAVAARIREDLVERHGDDGAFPAPRVLRALDLELPGRKTEYLRAVADALLRRCRRPGVPTAPGRPFTCAHFASNAPTSSVEPTATDPRGAAAANGCGGGNALPSWLGGDLGEFFGLRHRGDGSQVEPADAEHTVHVPGDDVVLPVAAPHEGITAADLVHLLPSHMAEDHDPQGTITGRAGRSGVPGQCCSRIQLRCSGKI